MCFVGSSIMLREYETRGIMDEELRKLAEREAHRRRKTLMVSGALALFAVILIGFTLAYREALVGPRIDVDAGEQEVFEQTNDPACRKMIDDVTAETKTWRGMQAEIRTALLSGEREQIETLQKSLGSLKERLAAIHASSKDANFRFQESRDEVDTWFRFVANEIKVFEDLSQVQLSKVDGQDIEVPGTRSPQELIDSALLATDDAFQSFRVWHSNALHPCGAATGQAGEAP